MLSGPQPCGGSGGGPSPCVSAAITLHSCLHSLIGSEGLLALRCLLETDAALGMAYPRVVSLLSFRCSPTTWLAWRSYGVPGSRCGSPRSWRSRWQGDDQHAKACFLGVNSLVHSVIGWAPTLGSLVAAWVANPMKRGSSLHLLAGPRLLSAFWDSFCFLARHSLGHRHPSGLHNPSVSHRGC